MNLSGGEPTLRKDLEEIVDVLRPKARTLEISTNGLLGNRLEPIISKHPDVKIRFSLDGIGASNDRIRGEADGFTKKVTTMKRLKALGGKDLGFGVVIQEQNATQLNDLFCLAEECGVELATTTVHNGFQFHKSDNEVGNQVLVAQAIEELARLMLRTWKVKYWFRAYLSIGLAARVLGLPRLLPCAAGIDFAFIDPWGDVFACNVRPDLKLGSLRDNSWEELFSGARFDKIAKEASCCRQNCWMVGSAKTAMRLRNFPSLPRWKPLSWVLLNKTRVTAGLPLAHLRASQVISSAMPSTTRRSNYSTPDNNSRRVQARDETHYSGFGEFTNL